jgi:hypothetical protein
MDINKDAMHLIVPHKLKNLIINQPINRPIAADYTGFTDTNPSLPLLIATFQFQFNRAVHDTNYHSKSPE